MLKKMHPSKLTKIAAEILNIILTNFYFLHITSYFKLFWSIAKFEDRAGN